jgi:hypothetical protein
MYKWLTILVMLLVVVEPVLGLLERYGIGRDMALVCAMSLSRHSYIPLRRRSQLIRTGTGERRIVQQTGLPDRSAV